MPNSPHVVIIACGAKKRATAARARDLYEGSYFKSNLKWALSVAPEDSIFILSAKHGLLSLNQAIEPYNVRMGDGASIAPEIIAEQAALKRITKHRLYAVGGQEYLSALARAGLQFCAPAAGLSLGYALSAMKRNLGVLPRWKAWA